MANSRFENLINELALKTNNYRINSQNQLDDVHLNAISLLALACENILKNTSNIEAEIKKIDSKIINIEAEIKNIKEIEDFKRKRFHSFLIYLAALLTIASIILTISQFGKEIINHFK